jgi:CheY-like chemotaxis protein
MKKRILVIDDEPDFTYMLKLSLESMGYYRVAVENEAARAVRAAREFAPDLIVLDIMMPGLDGSEVAARIRTDPELRDVPVLFMTALVSHREARGGSCSSGGQTFLPKTLGTGKLIECIEEKLAAAARERGEPVMSPVSEPAPYPGLVAMAG